jgi:transcriptional regulator with XRE-family HTH domain
MEQDYAKAFRICRAAFGLRQSELAERMPITPSQLSLIEAGKRQPSLRVVEALGGALGVPTALITLLASTPEDVKAQDAGAELASALLNTLVAASGPPTSTDDVGGKK